LRTRTCALFLLFFFSYLIHIYFSVHTRIYVQSRIGLGGSQIGRIRVWTLTYIYIYMVNKDVCPFPSFSLLLIFMCVCVFFKNLLK
jgi:hypothetical protein